MNTLCSMHSGIVWDLLNPDPEKVDIEDIAHALSYQCRFNGNTNQFYSVAEHSVRVSQILPPDMMLAGLLHDAAEAYLGDMIRPLKSQFPLFETIEDETMEVILEGLGVDLSVNPWHNKVREADQILLITEGRDLMPKGWLEIHNFDVSQLLPDKIVPWAMTTARARFLDAYVYLTSEVNV